MGVNVDQGVVNANPNTSVVGLEINPMVKSFTEAHRGNEQPIMVRAIPPPRFEGGNVIVELDEDDCDKEARKCQFDVIGRTLLQKGEKSYTNKEIYNKLASLWGIQDFDIAHMGNGFFHVFLNTSEN